MREVTCAPGINRVALAMICVRMASSGAKPSRMTPLPLRVALNTNGDTRGGITLAELSENPGGTAFKAATNAAYPSRVAARPLIVSVVFDSEASPSASRPSCVSA